MSQLQLKADFIIMVPPDRLAALMGITVVDWTAVNASTNKPKETRHVSLRKVQEQIFAALLQGYEVATDKRDDFTFIRIINRAEIERLNKDSKIEKRNA